jgi:hypothetical protein
MCSFLVLGYICVREIWICGAGFQYRVEKVEKVEKVEFRIFLRQIYVNHLS